jgi:hypothetical protein
MRVQFDPGEMKVGYLILEILATWSLVALIAGFGLGQAIRRGDRVRKDAFLSCVFANLESLPTSRS